MHDDARFDYFLGQMSNVSVVNLSVSKLSEKTPLTFAALEV